MISLTKQEYGKFSLWCQQQADSYEAITSEMEKSDSKAFKVGAKHNRTKMAAFRFIAMEMDSTEVINVSTSSGEEE